MEMSSISKKICTLRKELGLTQENLAEILGISPQAVSKWENGHALPETALLPGLARALDTSIDSLLLDSKLQILSAFYGDGIESFSVANRLNRLIANDTLVVTVNSQSLACPVRNSRPKFLIMKYRIGQDNYFDYVEDGKQLSLDQYSKGYANTEKAKIIAATYGTEYAKYDVMNKIEHYKVFNWNEYRADHEKFPSDPMNDGKDYLTFVYLNKAGIHMVTCEEGESIAYAANKTELHRKQAIHEHFIPDVPELPEFGKGMECSWAAALTAALTVMGVQTSYEHVMGVSGACYRLAFCSPMWDYSSADGLVAYDYATPGYMAFGYAPKFSDRVDKENRADERRYMLEQIRCNMPVLGINLRVSAEWGVICGYRNNGADLFCRTKYDSETLSAPDFQWNEKTYNPHNYLLVDNWPFIIAYFDSETMPPSARDNLLNSLRVFSDCTKQKNNRCYMMGLQAYDVWKTDLLDEEWYQASDDEQLARRFSVNQFCTLALFDARKAAYAYLIDSKELVPDKKDEMNHIITMFKSVYENAGQIHKMLDSGKVLNGAEARCFWTKQMREKQAELLFDMAAAERSALEAAQKIT
jgi:transcriptional regulator with XRE-family HTH domain